MSSEQRNIRYNMRLTQEEDKGFKQTAKILGFDTTSQYLRHAGKRFPDLKAQKIALLQVVTRDQDILETFRAAAKRLNGGNLDNFDSADEAVHYFLNMVTALRNACEHQEKVGDHYKEQRDKLDQEVIEARSKIQTGFINAHVDVLNDRITDIARELQVEREDHKALKERYKELEKRCESGVFKRLWKHIWRD